MRGKNLLIEKSEQDIVFTGDSLIRGYSVITRLPSGNKKRLQYNHHYLICSF